MYNTLIYIRDKLSAKITELSGMEHKHLYEAEIVICTLLFDLVVDQLELITPPKEEDF